MGGNSRAIDRTTGMVKVVDSRMAFAERVDLRKIDVERLRLDIYGTLNAVNKTFRERYEKTLWPSLTDFSVGHCFMGSARHLCGLGRPTTKDLVRHMPTIGDVDVAVPEESLEALWEHLSFVESESKCDDMTYLGQNRFRLRRPSINAVFLWNGRFLQVDFVGTKVDPNTGDVDPFVRFAHSSSWDDRKDGIKGVAHKYLLQTLAWSVSYDPTVIVLTDKSPTWPPDKVRIKTLHEPPRPMSFSVDRGIRMRLEQQFAPDGRPLVVLGKNAYKEVSTSDSKYVDDLTSVFMLLFGQAPTEEDMLDFESFKGLMRLGRKYLDDSVFRRALDFMIRYKLYGPGQALSRDSADEDRHAKARICDAIDSFANVCPDSNIVDEYYRSYKEREVTE